MGRAGAGPWRAHVSTAAGAALALVDTLTLHPGATLTITFTVRNGAATPCNYTAPFAAGAAPGPTATTLEAGPCGSVGFEILGPHLANVWPGVQVVKAGFPPPRSRPCPWPAP